MSKSVDRNPTNQLSQDLAVEQVMRSRRVAQMPPTATVRKACEIMAMLEMGAVPVVDDDRLVGIFTERDAVTQVLAQDLEPERTSLAEVMTSPVVTIRSNSSVAEASRIMRERGFRHLPVLEGERVLGIISLRDLMRQAAFSD